MTNKHVEVATDQSVRRLIGRYCHLIDDGDFKAVGDLFTDDCRFHAMGQDLRGRDALIGWMGTLPTPMWHSVTNVVVSNGSNDGTFHAVSDFAYSLKGSEGKWALTAVGRYHDTIVGEGRDMRFSQRLLTIR